MYEPEGSLTTVIVGTVIALATVVLSFLAFHNLISGISIALNSTVLPWSAMGDYRKFVIFAISNILGVVVSLGISRLLLDHTLRHYSRPIVFAFLILIGAAVILFGLHSGLDKVDRLELANRVLYGSAFIFSALSLFRPRNYNPM